MLARRIPGFSSAAGIYDGIAMSGQPVRRVASLFFIAGWFAMAGGLLEGCSYWLLQEAGLLTRDTELRSVDLNILWASLLVYGGFSLLVLLVVWPILSILARKYHKPWEGAAFIIFGWLLFYDLLSVPARLHERGAIILALGLATAVCRRMSRDTDRSLAWMRHTLKPLTALAALACVIGVAAQPILEKVRGARLPAPPGNVPNVLFIVLDTLRADRLNAYGYARPTSPFLERYAQQAVLFEKAFSNSSWTLPSHASFFTGWMPSVHGGTWQKINRDLPTLAQELDKRGYYTAGFAANTYWTTRFSGVASGFLHWENIFAGPMDSFMNTLWGRKIIKYAAHVVDWNGEPGRMMASDINARFLRWLDARPERPFFVYLNYMDVHDPYNPLLEYSRKISAHPEELTPQPP